MPLFNFRRKGGSAAGKVVEVNPGQGMVPPPPGSVPFKPFLDSNGMVPKPPTNGPKPVTPMTFAPGPVRKNPAGPTLKQMFEKKKSVTPNWQTGNVNGLQQRGWNN